MLTLNTYQHLLTYNYTNEEIYVYFENIIQEQKNINKRRLFFKYVFIVMYKQYKMVNIQLELIM